MMNNDMTDGTRIEHVVMRRVRLIRLLAFIVSTVTLAVLTGVAALWGIGKEVWVARVFENAPAGFIGHAEYLWYAFLHTRFVVQALSVLTLTSLFLLAREILRLLKETLLPVRT